MKKIINAKLKEAKQFNSTILENIKEAIPISNIILANKKKATNSFKQSKKSFLNIQNSSNETKTLIDEFIKASNDYNANPTEEKLKLINQQRSSLLYKINLNSNNVKIFSSDLLISKNDMLRSIEKIKEILPTLKDIKDNINKLNLTYLKINQLMKIKKTIKNLNNNKPKQITRPIFRVDPPEKPKCDEIRLLLLVEEANLNETIEKLKKIKNYDIFESYKATQIKIDEAEDKINDIGREIKELQQKDINYKTIEDINNQIKEVKEVVPQANVDKWKTPQEIIESDIEYLNMLQKALAAVIKRNNPNGEYEAKQIKSLTRESDNILERIDKNIELVKKYGTVSSNDYLNPVIKDLWAFIDALEKNKPNFTDYTVNLINVKLKETYKLKFELKDYEQYMRSIQKKAWDFEDDNRKLLNDIKISKGRIKECNRLLNPLLLLCDETTPTPV
jgi:hypothetical protein